MMLVNVEKTHKQLYDKLMNYIDEHQFNSMDDWDDEACGLWNDVKRFRSFCEEFFDIDRETLENTLFDD